MSEEQKIDDPTNRLVATFDDEEKARKAESSLLESGLSRQQVHVLNGQSAADEVDRSAKWFADTDVEMKKYHRELRSGATVISVPTDDAETREHLHQLMKEHDARHITHFGDWITEVMR